MAVRNEGEAVDPAEEVVAADDRVARQRQRRDARLRARAGPAGVARQQACRRRQLQPRQQQPPPRLPRTRHHERRGGFGLRARVLPDADAVQSEGDGRDLALHPGQQRVRDLPLQRIDGTNHRSDLVSQKGRVRGDSAGVGRRAPERAPIAARGRLQQGFQRLLRPQRRPRDRRRLIADGAARQIRLPADPPRPRRRRDPGQGGQDVQRQVRPPRVPAHARQGDVRQVFVAPERLGLGHACGARPNSTASSSVPVERAASARTIVASIRPAASPAREASSPSAFASASSAAKSPCRIPGPQSGGDQRQVWPGRRRLGLGRQRRVQRDPFVEKGAVEGAERRPAP